MDLLTCFVFLLVLGLSQRFHLLPSVPSPEEFLSDAMVHQSGVSVADESSRGPRRRLLEASSQAEGREAQRQMVRAAVERWRKEQRARDKREMNESMPNTQPPTGERFLLGPKITGERFLLGLKDIGECLLLSRIVTAKSDWDEYRALNHSVRELSDIVLSFQIVAPSCHTATLSCQTAKLACRVTALSSRAGTSRAGTT
ncbi:unnamed protein product, partial [Closterium sp. NIES-53]